MAGENGHNQALRELVEHHYEVLYRYAYRLTGQVADAEDLTQQTFLTAQRKLDQLREPEFARAWLFTIARNGYLKQLRSQPDNPVVSLEAIGEPTDSAPDELDVDSERLQHILNEMPEEFRSTVILFYFQEFSYKEIAAQLDLPIGTVMSRLARGKSYLRRRLGANHSDLVESGRESAE